MFRQSPCRFGSTTCTLAKNQSDVGGDASTTDDDTPSDTGPDAAAAAISGKPTNEVGDSRDLPRKNAKTKAAAADDKRKLRRAYGWGLFAVLGVQLSAADTAFFIFGWKNDWHFSAGVMEVWLSAAVVQVISLVYVIVRYLFSPDSDL